MKSHLNDFNVSDVDEDEEQADHNDVDDHDQHEIVEEKEFDDEYNYTEDEIGDSNDIQIRPPLTLNDIRRKVTYINHPHFDGHQRSCRVSILHTMDHLNQKLHIIENYETCFSLSNMPQVCIRRRNHPISSTLLGSMGSVALVLSTHLFKFSSSSLSTIMKNEIL